MMEFFFSVPFFFRIQPLVSLYLFHLLILQKIIRPTDTPVALSLDIWTAVFLFVPHQAIMLVHPASCLSLLAFIFFSCSATNLNNIFLLCLLCENKVHSFLISQHLLKLRSEKNSTKIIAFSLIHAYFNSSFDRPGLQVLRVGISYRGTLHWHVRPHGQVGISCEHGSGSEED